MLESQCWLPSTTSTGAGGAVDALRVLLEQLVARSGAVPLPDIDSVRGRPFSQHTDLAAYERSVLQVGH